MSSATEGEPADVLGSDVLSDVLVLGGSFLGIELVRRLRRSKRARALSVTVLDRQAEHPYIPLGHELVCERMPLAIERDTVLASARYVEQFPRTRWITGELVGFDPATRTATLADGRRLAGRVVVVALGSEVRAPALLPGSERLLGYKSEAQLLAARHALEQVAVANEQPRVVVVGGGISGVEIAGELAYLGRRRPPGWRAPQVVLVHAGSRLLPDLCERVGRMALAGLRSQGVEVLLETRLLGLEDGQARVKAGEGERSFACQLGFWAGGLQPPKVLAELGLDRSVLGWLRVDPQLRCVGAQGVFAGGDVARVYSNPEDPAELPWPNMQRAIEAIFAAKTLARNVVAAIDGLPERMIRHSLWEDFPHGVSAGGRSYVVFGPIVIPTHRINTWFRRFLMRQYMRRYRAQ